MSRMDPTVKARWVAALRSGKYKQGKSQLRSGEDAFCCLGVLCDLHDEHGWQPCDGGFSYGIGDVDNDEFELPPKPLVAEFGFDWERVVVDIGGAAETLYSHNDQGRTFAEIADAIEQQL